MAPVIITGKIVKILGGFMGIIGWIILGGLAGWLAAKLVDGGSKGIVVNIIVGIVGALIGGFLFNLLGGSGITGFNIWSFIVAVVGAIVLLWIVGMFRGVSTKKI